MSKSDWYFRQLDQQFLDWERMERGPDSKAAFEIWIIASQDMWKHIVATEGQSRLPSDSRCPATRAAEVTRAWHRTFPAHADHRVTAWDEDHYANIEIWCSCGSTGRLTQLAVEKYGQDNPQIPGICKCPMLLGGGINHLSTCPEMPGRGK